MPRSKTKRSNTYVLMHGKTELLRGDHSSIAIIYRNLTGQNPVHPRYTKAMDKQFGITVDPKKLWTGRAI
jgi:hypothetical protein